MKKHEKGLTPFLRWAGGKRWLMDNHADLFKTEYNRYIEPFLGSGAVFFSILPEKAILSDLNSELIDTYNAIKNDWETVQKYLNIHHKNHSKRYYYVIRAFTPRSPATKAARFIYLNRTCWNGLYRVNLEGKFNVPIGTKNKVILATDNFEGISKSLKNAKILHSDFEDTIDGAEEGDLVFVDPPYTVNHNLNGFVQYNEKIFSWHDQIRLRNCIERALDRGVKVLMTNANHKSVSQIYEDIGNHYTFERNSKISANASFRGLTDELIVKTWDD